VRIMALVWVLVTLLAVYRDRLDLALVFAVLTVAVSVLSLGTGWFGRTWREAYTDAKRENTERIELP
jgi:hypothetical protein